MKTDNPLGLSLKMFLYITGMRPLAHWTIMANLEIRYLKSIKGKRVRATGEMGKPMQTVYIDYETFFTTEYSLGRMTTREYIMDPRFEVIGASIALDNEPAVWFDGPDLLMALAAIDWANTRLVAHNTLFDGAITQWVYGYTPKLWCDSMGLAQALLTPTTGSAALKNLSHIVGRHKDTDALMNMKGVRLQDVDRSSDHWQRYKKYANEDVETCRALFKKLLPMMPGKELVIIDTLLRMYFDGILVLNPQIVSQSLSSIRQLASEALALANIPDASILRSRDKFADILRSHGVTPPTKISPANGETTYAFAKNDLAFTKLLDHPDPKIVALVEAKLNVSSSLEETRAKRFQNLAMLPGRKLHVPLRYYAAHTGRFGGSDNLNLQNLPRNSPLRDAIEAPEGHKIVVVDASQIEARILAWIAGCRTLTDAFAAGEDVYSSFATSIYNEPVNKYNAPDKRFVGKTGILGLGYGTGAPKFQWTLLTSPFYDGDAPDDFCQGVVDTYRAKYPEIPAFWKKMDHALHVMGNGQKFDTGPLRFRPRHVLLPSGLPMQYPQLHWSDSEEWSERGWQYYSAKYKSWKKIYGAALTENVVQALARIQITDTMLKLRAKDPDYFIALQVHDEIACVVPDHKAEACYHHMMDFMTQVPAWADETLPLAAEGGVADRYGDAK